jgi:hypothetical protein
MAVTPILTPALLTAIRNHPNLPRNSWYFIAATTLSAINRPDEVPNVLKNAIEERLDAANEGVTGRDEQRRITRRLREALVKASAVVGMPKVGTTFRIIFEHIILISSLDHQCLVFFEVRSARRPHERIRNRYCIT